MFYYESTCNSRHGDGHKRVEMVDFVDAAIIGLNSDSGAANKIMAIQAVRELSFANGLGSGLKECKLFVEAIIDFDKTLRGVYDE